MCYHGNIRRERSIFNYGTMHLYGRHGAKAIHGGILHYLGMPAVDWRAHESQL